MPFICASPLFVIDGVFATDQEDVRKTPAFNGFSEIFPRKDGKEFMYKNGVILNSENAGDGEGSTNSGGISRIMVADAHGGKTKVRMHKQIERHSWPLYELWQLFRS